MLVTHEPAWHPTPQPKVWDPPYSPTVYVIGWPTLDVVKVGYTRHRRRWTGFLGRGGEVVSLTFVERGDDPGEVIETWLLRELAERWPYAFPTRHGAIDILGKGGDGYMECFRIPAGAWPILPTGGEF